MFSVGATFSAAAPGFFRIRQQRPVDFHPIPVTHRIPETRDLAKNSHPASRQIDFGKAFEQAGFTDDLFDGGPRRDRYFNHLLT